MPRSYLRRVDDDRLLATALALREELSPIIEERRSVSLADIQRACARLYARWLRNPVGPAPVTLNSQRGATPLALELADLVCSL